MNILLDVFLEKKIPPSNRTVDMQRDEARLNYLYEKMNRVDSYINLSNVKASFIITSNAVIIALLVGNYSDFVSIFRTGKTAFLDDIALITIIATCIISLVYSLMVIYAQTKGQPNTESVFSFIDVKEKGLEDYKRMINEFSIESMIDSLIEQEHLMSGLVFKKFKYVNWSIYFLAASLCQLFIVVLISGVLNMI